jgi:hypothetical protein
MQLPAMERKQSKLHLNGVYEMACFKVNLSESTICEMKPSSKHTSHPLSKQKSKMQRVMQRKRSALQFASHCYDVKLKEETNA